MKNLLLAIDGNSLMHRAFWALPQMSDHNGRPTNAIYGFLNMLFNLIDSRSPTHVVVAFDEKGKTFRHDKFSAYKAGRRATPTELTEQLTAIKHVLNNIGISYAAMAPYEADDILGVFSQNKDTLTYIVTGDRDALQLVSDNVTVLLTKKGVTETEAYTEDYLYDKYALKPEQIIDLKALMGDSSDNIPGVAGVGEKTALKLLAEYGSIENLYNNIDNLPQNKLKEKLENDRENAFLSKELATIDIFAPIDSDLSKYSFHEFDKEALRKTFEEFNFGSFMKKFGIEKKSIGYDSIPVNTEELEGILKNAESFALYIDEDLHISIDGKREYVLKIKYNLLSEGCDYSEALDVLRRFSDKKIYVHDAKKLMHMLGMQLDDFFDCLTASWVVNPTAFPADFKAMCNAFSLPVCAASLFAVKEHYEKLIFEREVDYIYYKIELPLTKILYKMEKNGVYADKDQLLALKEKYKIKIEELAKEIYSLAGHEFNILSPKQLGTVLFEELMLPVVKKNKTGYSTDSAVLEKLEGMHPIIDFIKEYRQLTKLESTYVEGLLSELKNGKIHTTFLQTATATGRLSSVEPNLQNIPIKSELAADIRNVFTAPDDYIILSADYSQIELRILAHVADDDNLKDAFNCGQDIHLRTASEILGKPFSDISAKERSDAKAVNFGIVYGISDFGLARNTGISVKKASMYIQKYLQEFSGVKQYMDDIKQEAHKNGCVKTIWGRLRYIPELTSGNYNIRAFGERAALNTPIQGSAADIIKIAMIHVDEGLIGMKSRLVLQVHDELIIYAHKTELDRVKSIVLECMTNAAKLNVPLTVNIAGGKAWSEAK